MRHVTCALDRRTPGKFTRAPGYSSVNFLRATFETNHGHHASGHESPIVANDRFAPCLERLALRCIEQAQEVEHRDGRRMQAARIAIDDFERDSPAFAAHTDRLYAFRADFRHPIAASR